MASTSENEKENALKHERKSDNKEPETESGGQIGGLCLGTHVLNILHNIYVCIGGVLVVLITGTLPLCFANFFLRVSFDVDV